MTRRGGKFAQCGLMLAMAAAWQGAALGQTFLFDATKAEMAGNADWVVDADLHNLKVSTAADGSGTTGTGGSESNPSQFPTPTAVGIISTTAETYWKGALSSWGVSLVQHGYGVQSLPFNGRITYGDSSNAQDLSNYKVFVVDEPNIAYTAAEKTAILNFVHNGGGLMMISDHSSSDRNNDGIDSPRIWNDLLTNNGIVINPFGITFNNNDISQDSNFVSTTAGNPLVSGIGGTLTHLQYSAGSEITIDPTKNSSVGAAVWSASGQPNNHVLAAYSSYGLGRVVAIGDSSPMDDGTGDTNDTLFVGWPSEGGKEVCMNGSAWLASSIVTPGIWMGGNSNWSDLTRWSGGSVPANDSSIHVKIDNSNASASAVTLDQNATIGDLTLDSGDSLTINSAKTLTLSGPGISTFSGSINNAGTISVKTTTARFLASGTWTGTIAATSATLDFAAGTHSFSSTFPFTGSGTIKFSGATITASTLNLGSNLTINHSAGNVSATSIHLGVSAGATSVYNLTGGTLNVSTLAIGNDAGAGHVTISGGQLTAASILIGSATGGTGDLAWSGGALAVNNLTINTGGSMTLATGHNKTLVLSALAITGGNLDLNDNFLIATYTASSPTTAIRQMLVNGYGPGDWSGNTGITSSIAHADISHHHTLAYAEASELRITTFGGQTITGDAVVIKYTYPGDSNLDGIVDLDNDFSLFVDGYNKQLSNPSALNAGNLWVNGDYNYDGVIDLDNDFSIFVASYAAYSQDPTQLAQLDAIINSMDLTTAQKNVLLASVPEPASLGLAAISAAPLLIRRRRRN